MKPTLIILYIVLLLNVTVKAQYTGQGKIEYERKINVQRQFDDMEDNEWIQRIKSQIPKFKVSYFDLYFNTSKMLYKPGKEAPDNKAFTMFGNGPASDNIVYTDVKNKRVQASKQVYEQKFIIQDSMRKLKWKITDEIRTIANFKCRKAVSKICDSVYVVAFYTDDILVSGGPEMFSNLPGMIMELAIPRLYTTWVATNVELTPPKETDFTIPEKGKKITQKELTEKLQASLKEWGKSTQRNIWWCML